MKTSYSRAFTLIELLVVIAIIAILTGIILNSIVGARVKARDGRRISDVGQIQLAIEQYFDRCGQYPSSLSTSANNGSCPSGITLASFISVIPKDPSTNIIYSYALRQDSGYLNLDYVLGAALEANNNDALKNSLGAWPSNGTYSPTFNCDTSKNYCIGPK